MEKRVIINAPPRIGKTELVKHYIAWRFLNDPSSSVIYCSYDEKLVARKNREIKDLLIWLGEHFDIPELKPLPQVNGKTEWVNRANGTIIARGTNNALTGSGCSTLLVCDDPNKPADRMSATLLNRRNVVFKSTIRNRINTPDVPILIIQQRVASNDLTTGRASAQRDFRSKKSRSTRATRSLTMRSTCKYRWMTLVNCSRRTR